ncbi:MAG: hypothetical protein A4E57_03576 [Syntrophorhabdaceae bacterium PtaU1.Bin034]|nr:MAG: hypothetical protein A4E57_03576 [Syntrophorhabdaceae bacterium PtaU1.Bin034]
MGGALFNMSDYGVYTPFNGTEIMISSSTRRGRKRPLKSAGVSYAGQIGIGGDLSTTPLPRHPACGSAPGDSRS